MSRRQSGKHRKPRSRSLPPFIVALVLATVIRSPVFAQNQASESTGSVVDSNLELTWPQFRGQHASGVAAGNSSLPSTFGPDENLLWKTPLPDGVSSPCIWKGRIFLTGFSKETQTLEAFCIDRSDGDVLWRRPLTSTTIEKVHEVSSPANSTPATDGKHVFVYFASYGVLCYDFDGNELWKHALPFRQISFGNGASPIVANGKVILNLDSPHPRGPRGAAAQTTKSSSQIVAFDCETGEAVWETTRNPNERRYSSPAVWPQPNGDHVVLFGWSELSGYSLSTGEELWRLSGMPPQACATPIFANDHIFITATGIFGEPETLLDLPPYEDFRNTHDADKDGLVGLIEIPEDLPLIERRATGGAGNRPLRRYAAYVDGDKDEKISADEWKKLGEFARQRLRSEPGLYSIRLHGSGDSTKAQIAWHQKRGVADVPTPLIYHNRLYVVRNGGIVHCRNPLNGQQIFRGRLGAIGGYYASPVAGDGKVYFASDRGVVTVINSSDSLEVLGTNDLRERILATPALVGGKIYVRTDEHLYAFGE